MEKDAKKSVKTKLAELKNKAVTLGKKKKKLSIAVIALVVIIIITCAFSFSGTAVETAKAEIGTAADYYSEDGTLTGTGDCNVIARCSGEIAEVLVSENDVVKEGDVLLQIDTTDYERQLKVLQAKRTQTVVGQVTGSSPAEYVNSLPSQVSAAKAAYEAAKTSYEAGEALYKDGGISYLEFQKIKSDYETAKAAYNQASTKLSDSRKAMNSSGLGSSSITSAYYGSERDIIDAQIEQLEEDIDNCSIKAESDGVVTSIPVKEQSSIEAGTVAVCISGKTLATAEADVLTSAAPYIKKGTKCEITVRLRGADITAKGKVTDKYDYADEGVSSLGLNEYRVHVKVAIDSKDAADFSEMTGYGVEIKFCLYEKEDALKVPSSAVYKVDGQNYVYRLKGGKAVATPVEVEYSAGDTAVILSGIEEGDKVVKTADDEEVYDGAHLRSK